MYATFQARESNEDFEEEDPEENKGYVLSTHLQWFTYTHSSWYIHWDTPDFAEKYFKEHITDFFDATSASCEHLFKVFKIFQVIKLILK